MSIKIQILIDDHNSWILKYPIFSKIKKKIKNFSSSQIIHQNNKIKNNDILFLLSCKKILNKRYLLKSKHNIVIHPSKLPKGRGFSPLEWQILDGKSKIWFTAFEATERFDEGNIYIQSSVKLKGNEIKQDLKNIQFENTMKIIYGLLEKYPKLKNFHQKGNPSFYKKRHKWSNKLDINKNLRSQFNILRIADNENYPAYFNYRNKKFVLKIYKSEE